MIDAKTACGGEFWRQASDLANDAGCSPVTKTRGGGFAAAVIDSV
jgi:hypothetical protein